MTTINCSLNCKHQKDGRCTLEDAASMLSVDTDCVFLAKPDKAGAQPLHSRLNDNYVIGNNNVIKSKGDV